MARPDGPACFHNDTAVQCHSVLPGQDTVQLGSSSPGTHLRHQTQRLGVLLRSATKAKAVLYNCTVTSLLEAGSLCSTIVIAAQQSFHHLIIIINNNKKYVVLALHTTGSSQRTHLKPTVAISQLLGFFTRIIFTYCPHPGAALLLLHRLSSQFHPSCCAVTGWVPV